MILLKDRKIRILAVAIVIAFFIGFTIGEITCKKPSDYEREKSAYELIEEGMERIKNE